MATKDKFLFSKDKHQIFTNNVSFSDKNGRYLNLNLNQNQKCPISIPVHYSNNPKNDKYGDSKVSDKYDKWGKSEAWNKSIDLCFRTLTLDDKQEAKKKWKKDVLSDSISSTLSLHISAYENSKEITGFDTLDDVNVGFKGNKIIMDKQDFLRLTIQNPFEFPRQQEENGARKPEVMGFKARYRFFGFEKPAPLNASRIPNSVADSNVRYFNQERTPNVQPSLLSHQMQQQQFHGHQSDLGSSGSMHNNFRAPLPPQQRHQYARDPRQCYQKMNGYRNTYPSTPQCSSSLFSRSTPYNNPAASPFNDFRPTSSSQYRNTSSSTASPFNNVQATPKSPYVPASPSTLFDSSSSNFATSRSTSKIIEPLTFDCFDFEHPDLAAAFYQTFKALPPDCFNHEVQAKCLKVLKHVLNKERSEHYRQKFHQLCLDLCQKEKPIQNLRINGPIAEEAAIRASIQVEAEKFKTVIDNLLDELSNEKMANNGMQRQLKNQNDLEIRIQNLKNENDRLQEKNEKLMQEQHDFVMLKKENEELKVKNKKLESEAEKNLEAEQKLEAITALATSAKSCDLTVTKRRKERMYAETDLLKTQEKENGELKNKNKINEERIAILEEQLKKAEAVSLKRAAETYEDVAPKRAKTRSEMRQDLHNLFWF